MESPAKSCKLVSICLRDLTLPLAAAATASTVCTGKIGIGRDSSVVVVGGGGGGGGAGGAEGCWTTGGGVTATSEELLLQKVGLLGSGMSGSCWLPTEKRFF